jgi:hypothetical protein
MRQQETQSLETTFLNMTFIRKIYREKTLIKTHSPSPGFYKWTTQIMGMLRKASYFEKHISFNINVKLS